MDNYAIADQLSLLAKLMDIHGENAFKAKSYGSAAFALEKYPAEIAGMPKEKIFAIRGIGESVGSKIIELIETGSIQQLQQIIQATPEGVLEMMNIKGLGPKKIHTLWKEEGIDSIAALMEACADNRVAAIKGFGAKTQEKIVEAIRFQQQSKGSYLYASAEPFAEAFTEKLKLHFPGHQFAITGDFRRQMEIIETLDWVTTAPSNELQSFLLNNDTVLVADRDGMLIVNAEGTLLLRFYITTPAQFGRRLFETSSSEAFLQAWPASPADTDAPTEDAVFNEAGIAFIPAFLRESANIIRKGLPHDLVQVSSIKGLIHAHSNWSDGGHPLEEMAHTLIAQGFEYLVISDHSKAAYYANGLTEERIRAQHQLIDDLNRRLAPFKIFKSIECDILSDGALDYSNDVLASFDLVIASVHSNLDMPEEKAMLRLMGAITNPYTTIMGHLTGRLLLKRKGYPVNHKAIIDACAANHVAIEINAHPVRLDMDWRWVDYAKEKAVLLSINPDAHTTSEFQNIKYGVLVAQKGGLQASQNLSSFSLPQFEKWLSETKSKKWKV